MNFQWQKQKVSIFAPSYEELSRVSQWIFDSSGQIDLTRLYPLPCGLQWNEPLSSKEMFNSHESNKLSMNHNLSNFDNNLNVVVRSLGFDNFEKWSSSVWGTKSPKVRNLHFCSETTHSLVFEFEAKGYAYKAFSQIGEIDGVGLLYENHPSNSQALFQNELLSFEEWFKNCPAEVIVKDICVNGAMINKTYLSPTFFRVDCQSDYFLKNYPNSLNPNILFSHQEQFLKFSQELNQQLNYLYDLMDNENYTENNRKALAIIQSSMSSFITLYDMFLLKIKILGF